MFRATTFKSLLHLVVDVQGIRNSVGASPLDSFVSPVFFTYSKLGRHSESEDVKETESTREAVGVISIIREKGHSSKSGTLSETRVCPSESQSSPSTAFRVVHQRSTSRLGTV